MSAIKLINENGVIKGIDADTGEEVPVKFDELKSTTTDAEKTVTETVYADINGITKLLNINPEDIGTWEANNAGAWPDRANEFHTVRDIETNYRIEHENLSGEVQHILEAADGEDAWYGVQQSADHPWSWGVQARAGDRFVLANGVGVASPIVRPFEAHTDGVLSTPRPRLGGTYHLANDDGELTDLLTNDVSRGDTVILGNSTFSINRTITNQLTFLGSMIPDAGTQAGTEITGAWTVNDRCNFERVKLRTGTLTLNAILSSVTNCHAGTVQVNADRCRIVNNNQIDVTFAAGTANGVVDDMIGPAAVDDPDGNNQIGIIT